MSLFKKKAPKYTPPPVPQSPVEEPQQQANGVDNNNGAQKSQLVFHCQQAHGSPLGLISGFSNVKELYQKIAECYDFPPDEVRFIFHIFEKFYKRMYYVPIEEISQEQVSDSLLIC